MTETTHDTEVLPPLENGHIAAFNATEAGLATLRAELEGKTFDCSDRAQDAEARSTRRELVSLRTTIEQRRKELKAPLLERGRVLDDEAKRITGEVLKLEQPIDEQIKAEEKRKADEKAERERAEAERAAKVAKAIDAVRQLPVTLVSADSQTIELELVELGSATPVAGLDATDAEAAQAFAVVVATQTSLRTLADAAKAREDEAARLQREREELDRQRQEEEARAAAERGRQMAEAAAERERLNAEAAKLRQQQEAAARESAEKHAAQVEAQRQRWASRKVLKGAAMTDVELGALTELLMTSDGPAGTVNLAAHAALTDWTDVESRKHGFTDWVDALHGLANTKDAPAEVAA